MIMYEGEKIDLLRRARNEIHTYPKTMFWDISYNNLRGSHGMGCQQVNEANRACSADQNSFSQSNPGPLAGMNANSQGLHEGTLLQTDIVW